MPLVSEPLALALENLALTFGALTLAFALISYVIVHQVGRVPTVHYYSEHLPKPLKQAGEIALPLFGGIFFAAVFIQPVFNWVCG